MKFFKTTALCMGLLFAPMVFASTGEGLTTYAKVVDAERIALFIKDGESAMLRIRNERGATLYSERSRQGEYAKKFDLNNLRSGRYLIEIENDEQMVILPIQVLDDTIRIVEEETISVFKPAAVLENEMLKVSMPSMNGTNLNVKIYDEDAAQIFTEEVEYRENGLNRVYDLSQVTEGDYVFAFKTHGKTFRQVIHVK